MDRAFVLQLIAGKIHSQRTREFYNAFIDQLRLDVIIMFPWKWRWKLYFSTLDETGIINVELRIFFLKTHWTNMYQMVFTCIAQKEFQWSPSISFIGISWWLKPYQKWRPCAWNILYWNMILDTLCSLAEQYKSIMKSVWSVYFSILFICSNHQCIRKVGQVPWCKTAITN